MDLPRPGERPDDRPVVVGFDGSAPARAALRFAARHAVAVRAPLRVVAVARDLADGPSSLTAAERALAAADRLLRASGTLDARAQVRCGPVARGLLEAAAGSRVLVVGRGARPGPVVRDLLAACPVPLALVPVAGARSSAEDVLVPLAGDASDVPVLAEGRDWAVRRGSRLHVVHALRTGPRTPARPGAPGTAADDGACLVVLAHRGDGAEDLLGRQDRPVLLVPG
ncbi:universal stress protein [Kineococcus aurantiacus]|uniref:Nucleotide-binding universal stress UspA family protein n=1 Tax=Kineococcus aurantiacus TaxID=37633 RepID=A0A7Y9DNA4_9ACTN|nr:nucleotide-binding universal stress UspA family protein [Kineococcus aurantiacus]